MRRAGRVASDMDSFIGAKLPNWAICMECSLAAPIQWLYRIDQNVDHFVAMGRLLVLVWKMADNYKI